MDEFGIINTNCWQEIKTTPEIKSFVNTDEPQVIHIVKSGWQYPQMFSIIIEDGELGYPNMEFLDKEQIQNKYNITI
jgi:hypothetical protein